VRRGTACVLLLMLAARGAGCGSGSGSDTSKQDAVARAHTAALARAQAVLHARRMTLGRQVFAHFCESCHTLAGKHFTGPIIEFEAPNLDEVRVKRDYVRYRIEFGGPSMATFVREMPRAQFDALVEYVTETAGRNVVDNGNQPAEVLAAGKLVFAQHCAACHAIAGRAATGRPTFPGTDFTLAKPSERWILKRLNSGILPTEPMMPSFRGKLTDAQMRAVATYVTAVAKEGPEAPVPRPAE